MRIDYEMMLTQKNRQQMSPITKILIHKIKLQYQKYF